MTMFIFMFIELTISTVVLTSSLTVCVFPTHYVLQHYQPDLGWDLPVAFRHCRFHLRRPCLEVMYSTQEDGREIVTGLKLKKVRRRSPKNQLPILYEIKHIRGRRSASLQQTTRRCFFLFPFPWFSLTLRVALFACVALRAGGRLRDCDGRRLRRR